MGKRMICNASQDEPSVSCAVDPKDSGSTGSGSGGGSEIVVDDFFARP